MDRRIFFKTMFSTSLFAPLLLASKTTTNSLELYCLAEEPQVFLPLLIRELEKNNIAEGSTFGFIGAHPKKDEIP